MEPEFERQCEELLAFRRCHDGRVPCQSRSDPVENRLGIMKAKLKMRCHSPLGPKTAQRKLLSEEAAHFEWCLSEEAIEDTEDPSTTVKCVEMEAFLEMHRWRRPARRSTDPEERKLRKIWDDLLRRCAGPIGQGIKPSERKLTPQARACVERIEQQIEKRATAVRTHVDSDASPLATVEAVQAHTSVSDARQIATPSRLVDDARHACEAIHETKQQRQAGTQDASDDSHLAGLHASQDHASDSDVRHSAARLHVARTATSSAVHTVLRRDDVNEMPWFKKKDHHHTDRGLQ